MGTDDNKIFTKFISYIFSKYIICLNDKDILCVANQWICFE